MKKSVVIALLCGIAGIAVGFFSSTAINNEETYPQTAIVTEIDGNTVEVTDGVGNSWLWEGAEDYQLGDCVSMIMDSHGTPVVFDDSILKMKYSCMDWR